MSDTTHEAPERIWITGDASKGSWNSLKANFEGPTETEYVRADRIRKLDRECGQWDKLFQRTYQRVKKAEAYATELEANLAKAVEALQTLKDWPEYRLLSSQEYAHNTLAELKGDKT
jgi:hypothetical protein